VIGRRASRAALAALWASSAVAQQVPVPPGLPIPVEIKVPIEASRVGVRFAGVLTADLVVEFMLVAAAGDACSGSVIAGSDGALTLRLEDLRRPRGRRKIVAGGPVFGPDQAAGPKVVGFAGSLAGAGSTGPSRAGEPVVGSGGKLALAGGTRLEFRLEQVWEVPLQEAVSVFPQPEGAEPSAEARAVPNAWYAQVEKQAQQQQRAQQRPPQRPTRMVGFSRDGQGWGRRGPYQSAYGTPFPTPTPDPLRSMTPGQRAAAGMEPAVLPAGTKLIARTLEPIDSSKVEPGTGFGAVLMTDLVAAGRILFQRGSPAGGVLTLGQLGADLVPTLALTWLQLGGTGMGIRTGAVRILHMPVRDTAPAAVGLGSLSGAPPPAPPADGALRLPDGTILEFGLAEPLTVR
jgi:hypothetical protein